MRIARPALDYFDSSLATPYHLGSGSDDEVNCMISSKNGELWVGTSGGLYRLAGGSFTSVLRGPVGEIHEGVDGHLLIVIEGRFVEWNGRQIVEHPEFRRKLGIKPEDVIDVVQDHKGSVWFCTIGGLSTKSANGFSRF